MNHLFDQIVKIAEEANSSKNLEIFTTIGFNFMDRFADKGIVVDKVAGDYDVSSTLPVASDGFPSNQTEAANFFMICRPVGNVYYGGWEEMLTSIGVQPGNNADTSVHHLPSVAALQSNYLTAAQLSNFLSWTPVGVQFPQAADINVTNAMPA